MDVVSREQTGLIAAVTLDASASRAALNQTVISPVAPDAVIGDITPGVDGSEGLQNVKRIELTITKSRSARITWNGEEELALSSAGTFPALFQNQIQQGFRGLCKEVENDLAMLYKTSSRAYGTAGTTPFAADMSDTANILKILNDNGAPTGDQQLVINTTAAAKLRSLGMVTKVNEAGDASLARQGILLDMHGFAMRESAAIRTKTKGDGAGYLVNKPTPGVLAIGETVIPVDTGTGAIEAGDIVTFNGDPNKYVVSSGLSGGAFTIAAPGLLKLTNDNVAVTVGNSYTANMAFARSAIVLAARTPAIPSLGDSAHDRTIITDPVSNLSFDIAVYRQYHQVTFEIGLAWGVTMAKSEHAALLLG
ncbi:P22 coat - protein 5 family protein [Methylomonas koyamae]|nr:P22 coat - protein 5 family protein [Methylomonas koyamae]